MEDPRGVCILAYFKLSCVFIWSRYLQGSFLTKIAEVWATAKHSVYISSCSFEYFRLAVASSHYQFSNEKWKVDDLAVKEVLTFGKDMG